MRLVHNLADDRRIKVHTYRRHFVDAGQPPALSWSQASSLPRATQYTDVNDRVSCIIPSPRSTVVRCSGEMCQLSTVRPSLLILFAHTTHGDGADLHRGLGGVDIFLWLDGILLGENRGTEGPREEGAGATSPYLPSPRYNNEQLDRPRAHKVSS